MAYAKMLKSAADAGKIVALYVRVSTGYQVDKDSLPFQKKELTAYCKHILHAEKIEIFEADDEKDPRRGNIPCRRL